MDDLARHLYLSRLLRELRQIEARTTLMRADIESAVAGGPESRPMMALNLGAWVERQRTQLDHVDVDLFVIAFEPPPPVWLVWVPPAPVPWWRLW